MTSLRRTRSRRLLAWLCIVAVLVAPLTHGATAWQWDVPEPAWLLLARAADHTVMAPVEHACALGTAAPTRLPARAPPMHAVHA